MVDQKTAHLRLPLPHQDNSLDEDLPRVRSSLQELDAHARTTDAALDAHKKRLAEESQARQQDDAAQSKALAVLQQELAALTAKVAALKVDPWDVFPPRVPVAVDGVTFEAREETRPVLDEEGQPMQGEEGEPMTETVIIYGRHPIMPGEAEPRENWLICDGGSDGKGGTVPDLRGRMILGASDTHQAGDIGGKEIHEHSLSGTVGATTLTEEQLASHGHKIHATRLHNLTAENGNTGPWCSPSQGAFTISATGSSHLHTHSLTGSSGAANNLPPYYALAYIS